MKLINAFSRLIAVVVLIAVVLNTSAIAAEEVSVKSFLDVEYGHENYTAIQYLLQNKVVQGYQDGSFKPKNHINRAEFLKIVMEAAALETEGVDCYKDVRDSWYSPYVCGATKLKLVSGYPDGYFRPEKDINFVEASKIIANAMGLETLEDDGQAWYDKYVNAMEDGKAIPKSVSAFDHKLTRGEMAEMVWRLKEQPKYVSSLSYMGIERRERAAASDYSLQKFDSCMDMGDYLQENAQPQSYYEDDVMMMKSVDDESEESADGADVGAAQPTVAPSEGLGGGQEDPSYSSTNVQVEGVDEADIVKTDGQYVFLLKGNNVRVVKAYPPGEMVELERINFTDDEFYPTEMYVEGNRLVVVGTVYDPIFSVMEDYGATSKMMMPVEEDYSYYYGGSTQIHIFDISNKEDVKLLRKLAFEGEYSDSRKVDEMVYLVINKYGYPVIPLDYEEEKLVPLYLDSESDELATVAGCGDIYYFPGVESNDSLIIVGIPTDTADAKVNKEVIVGGGENIYASRDNLYVAQSKYGWYWEDGDDEETIVNKFSLGRDAIKYLGKGNVPGTILNQFSMDEYQDHFRIATTVGNVWDEENLSTNNLYILDKDLKEKGKIEGIAPGEKIYSVRFMGAKAYMVTFKKVDPFFVIDVGSPASPKILGKLKIPGYSDYLHPFDENHIIGFGKEAAPASEDEKTEWSQNFAWYQGMKVAMFDVTNVEDPKELHKIVIGDRGTESELLRNHKALMFDKARGIMAFPVTLAQISEDKKAGADDNTYGDYVFQGAYVYKVSVENGFEEVGRITHYHEDEIKDKSGYYWSGEQDIERILYIGDFLYTVSQAAVLASQVSDLAQVKRVDLAD